MNQSLTKGTRANAHQGSALGRRNAPIWCRQTAKEA